MQDDPQEKRMYRKHLKIRTLFRSKAYITGAGEIQTNRKKESRQIEYASCSAKPTSRKIK